MKHTLNKESEKKIIEEKTEIEPAVLIIHPSGFTDFVEENINGMSLSEMAELIDADTLSSVPYSDTLSEITQSCGLPKQLRIYFDSEGIKKGLKYNPVATMLFDEDQEIRGAVIICMEGDNSDRYSFDTDEDIENVFESIFDITGGPLIRDLGQEDGRYDAWC